MPITRLQLTRFKCYEDSGGIPIAPLTLVFGKNNTGKSSILQSLLLLRQTLDAPDGPRLNLRGPLYAAGTYADVVHKHRSADHFSMKFWLSYMVREQSRHAEIEFDFVANEPLAPRVSRLEVRIPDADSLEIRRGRGKGGPYELLIGRRNLGNERTANFRFPVNRFLPLIGSEPPRAGRRSGNRESVRYRANEALGEFERVLREARAVGAFRREPARRYDFQGRVQDRVDLVGENVVDALIDDTTRRGRRGELIKGVNRWLREVGRVRLLPLRRISKTARLYEVRVRDTDSGRWANFADVGFGIGQAFPVFVEGLRTPPGALFLVQEPEIHLHPDAQLAMADFLIDLAVSGRRVIVETHSENLLLRVRRRIVEQNGNGRRAHRLPPNAVSIIHVSKDDDGSSHARPLRVSDLGQVENWPAEFMEEATDERMTLLEALAKRVES